jgi:hypothetical protein
MVSILSLAVSHQQAAEAVALTRQAVLLMEPMVVLAVAVVLRQLPMLEQLLHQVKETLAVRVLII